MEATAIKKPDRIHLEPGVFPGMSMADYMRVDAISSHTLQWMDVTPAHFKAAIDGHLEREDTEAFAFGRAFHCRLLEPEAFAERYAVRQPCEAVLQSGKRKGEPCGNPGVAQMDTGVWVCGQHGAELGDKPESVSQSELDRIECCVHAVRQHKAVNLLRTKGQCEVAIVSEFKGVPVKARLDKLILNPPVIVDVKKVAAPASPGRAAATEDRFVQTIPNYGYDVQAGLYHWIVAKQFNVNPQFWWLLVEDDLPNSVAVYKPCKSTLKACVNHALMLLERVAECRKTNNWPGLPQDVCEVSAPEWFLRRYGQS